MFTERPETGLPIQAESIHRWSGICTMDNKQVNKAPQKSARLVLQAVTAIARSNANSLCRGLLYEPKVPTQLKK